MGVMVKDAVRVLVFYTGGTIGMRRGPRGYEPSPGFLRERLLRTPQLHEPGQPELTTPPSRSGRRIHYEVREYARLIDSASISLTDWARLANDIFYAYHDFDAFVVLHGTDTLAYTASALSFMLEGLTKPVILTGSQISLENLRNDALDNLLGALGLAGHYAIPEVSVYFHHRLMRGNRTKKVSASTLDAFESPNFPALAEVGVEVEVHWHRVRKAPYGGLRVQPHLSPHVAALRLYPGITPKILANLLLPPLEGLVLETFGSGNGPEQEAFIEPLRAATERGVVSVNVTQCARGRVHTGYASSRLLFDAGVVPGADLTAEAALAKLSYLLGQGMAPAEVRNLVGQSLRGELTER